jgi:hypothetical protein
MMEIETRALSTAEVCHNQSDTPEAKGTDRAHLHVLRMCAIPEEETL